MVEKALQAFGLQTHNNHPKNSSIVQAWRAAGLASIFLLIAGIPLNAELVLDTVQCTEWWITAGVDIQGAVAWNGLGVREKVVEAFKLYGQCRNVNDASHLEAWGAIENGGSRGRCTVQYGFRTWPGPSGDDSGRAFNYFIKTWPSFLPNMEIVFRKAFDFEKKGKTTVSCKEVYQLARGDEFLQERAYAALAGAGAIRVQANTPASSYTSDGGVTVITLDRPSKITQSAGTSDLQASGNVVRINDAGSIDCSGQNLKANPLPVRLSSVDCVIKKGNGKNPTQMAITREEPKVAIAGPNEPLFACNNALCAPVEIAFERMKGGFRLVAAVDHKPLGIDGVFVQQGQRAVPSQTTAQEKAIQLFIQERFG